MNDMETTPNVIQILSESSVFLARLRARELAQSLGFSPARVAELETAVSEGAQNAWAHAGGGDVEISVLADGDHFGIMVAILDTGPGIDDIERVMQGGHSTVGTLGLGLSACTRLMDRVEIETGEAGTRLRMWKWNAHAVPPRVLQATRQAIRRGVSIVDVTRGGDSTFGDLTWARGSRPCQGEHVAGDGAFVKTTSRGELIVVVDGAGHGRQAALACTRALDIAARNAEQDLATLFAEVHAGLRDTVGAAMTAAHIDARANVLDWAGVGNVEAVVWRADHSSPDAALVVRAGTLGKAFPPLHTYQVSMGPDDCVLLWTDGIRASSIDEGGPSRRADPVDVVRHVLGAGARDNDDALVLAARYRGGSLR